ncbi:hypothetical protein HID58_070403 [Brassica napus]|uniref:Uncharacterized protein n=1 Tax=Brassica napus TaxID=3708 RepID=A0ABQ7YYP9_BRANA|nr:hypothetical protein HID58_070403 [Brassica napus]
MVQTLLGMVKVHELTWTNCGHFTRPRSHEEGITRARSSLERANLKDSRYFMFFDTFFHKGPFDGSLSFSWFLLTQTHSLSVLSHIKPDKSCLKLTSVEPVQPSRHDSLIQDETGRFQKQKKKENCLVPKPVLGSVTTNF